MEIRVEGKGLKGYRPNQMNLRFEFVSVEQTQNKAIESGLQSVRKYVDFLTSLNIKNDDIQTNNMIVQQNKVYNETLRTYENKGYKFIQSILIKADYNLDLLATLIAETAKFSTPPNYDVSFGISDENMAKEEVLSLAYKDAEFQAKAIAKASGKQLGECVSVSFEPFQERIRSYTNFEATCDMVRKSSAMEDIKATFVPADVNVEKTIYCLFNTRE